MLSLDISREEIQDLKEKGLGLYEARKILIKERLLKAIESATTIDEIKDILHYIVKNG
jgi:hypothetical protein